MADFDKSWLSYRDEHKITLEEHDPDPEFDLDDQDELRRRLPRLADLLIRDRTEGPWPDQ
jgi:hypothetical protein